MKFPPPLVLAVPGHCIDVSACEHEQGHVECVYEPVGEVVPFGGIRRIVMSDDDEDDAYRLGDVCRCRPFHGYIRCFRSPCAGSWPTSHHFLSRQAGLPLMLRSLFLSAHFSGYFTYLCMTGLAVPTIQQFFGHLRTMARTYSARALCHISMKSGVWWMLPIDFCQYFSSSPLQG